MAQILPFDRMYPMRYHPEQARLWQSVSRYNVVPAGRRSGKTEICGKRKLIARALMGAPYPDPRFFAAAPTRDQAKRIYWKDLKLMTPKEFVTNISETMLCITLVNNAEIHVLGMDKPERIEGSPWDGGCLDEYANMKKDTWPEHVRPSLSDRLGWCDFIGVPEGRNHYYDLYKDAQSKALHDVSQGKIPEWSHYHWNSADILPASEIEAAKRDLDELTFQQEYEASFVNFTGRAYWAFTESRNCGRLNYNPEQTIEMCFDFNVEPGVAAVVQDQWLPTSTVEETWGCGVIGEVFIPRNSNTYRVCDKLIEDWGRHKGKIVCYGDQTGGARGTAKVLGSDWQLIKEKLWGHFGRSRVSFSLPKSNPRERDRVNSANSRCLSTAGDVRFMIDPGKAPHTVRCFEGTALIEGGTGEIDKNKEDDLSHLSDAIGYRIWRKHPVKRKYAPTGQKYHK